MTEHDGSDDDLGQMQISEVADRVDLSHRTIRYYDDERLLVPARSPGNYRLYTTADVQRLLLIKVMKPLGFSVDEMRQVIAALDQLEAGGPERQSAVEALQPFVALAKHRRDKMVHNLAAAERWVAELDRIVR